MKKLWVRWTALLVFVVAIGALFIRLGEWQLHRLAWRRGNNAVIVKYESQAPRPYQEVWTPGRVIGDKDQYQKVTLTGTYDASHQLVAILRNTNDATSQAGSEVLTPMHTNRGDWVLVDRGFIVRPDGTSETPTPPAPPRGTVTITGYVRRDEQGKQGAVVPENDTVRLVNIPEINKTMPYTLVDGYVGVVQSSPHQSGNLLPMVTPPLTEGPHLSYAIQWFLFTAIAAGGALILIRGDLRAKEKAEQKQQRRAARLAREAARTEAARAAGPGAADPDDTTAPGAVKNKED